MANDGIINRTFVTAHLLTGRIDLAENATLEAIDAWKPDIESAQAILGRGVAAALRKREGRDAFSLSRDNVTPSYLPAEIRTVLELSRVLRRSFVLRLVAGFPREDCAELLGCPPERVDRAARTAARLLPSFQRVNSRGERMELRKLTNLNSTRLPMISGFSGAVPWDLLTKTGFAPSRNCAAKPLTEKIRPWTHRSRL
jgi:hypothetical protein